jgi:hypothetical protein
MLKQFSTPILFLVFNRPDVTQKVFNRIREVKPKYLFIAADGARIDKEGEVEKCLKVRKIIDQIDWECEVKTLFREKNLGCKIAVSSAISWFFEHVEDGIILEDDCLPHYSFFNFCENLLEKYRDDKRVMMISGSNFQCGNSYGDGSYYFSRFAHIWGWATWKRAWKLYDVETKNFSKFIEQNKFDEVIFDHEELKRKWIGDMNRVANNIINTWDYQWSYAVFSNFALSATPNVNLISNIGFAHQDATFTQGFDPMVANLPASEIAEIIHPTFVMPSRKADDYIAKNIYFRSGYKKQKKRLIKRIVNKMKFF